MSWLFVTPWAAARQACLSLNHLPEFAQVHVHWISDAIQPSHSLLPSSFCLQSFPASGSFLMSQLFTSCGQSIGASALASILPMNIQGWFPLEFTDLISLQSKGLPSLLQHHNSKASSLLHSAFLWSNSHICTDYWKDHSFDYMDLCQQNEIFDF